MWKTIRQYIVRVSQAGCGLDLTNGLGRRIWVTNTFSLIFSSVTFPYSLVFYFLGVEAAYCLFVDFVAIFYLWPVYLNSKGHFYLSRIFLILWVNLAITFYCLVFGTASGLQAFFLGIAILPVVIFRRDDRFWITVGFLLPLCLYFAVFYMDAWEGLLVPLITIPYIRIVLVPTVFFATACLIYALQYTHDIADEALRQAVDDVSIESTRLHQILDAMADIVILSDSQSKPIWGNKAFRRFFEVTEKNADDMFDGLGDRLAFTQSVNDQKVIQTHQPYYIEMETMHRPDGSLNFFEIIKSPIFDRLGRVRMIVSVCRDITEQHMMEELLAQQKLQMVTTAKLSALGEMSAGIAHEINNPLAIIVGRTLTLRRVIETDPSNLPIIRDFIRDIEETSFRIVKIINGLRSFSRSGEQDPFTNTTVGKILDETLPLCAARFSNAGVDLIVDEGLHDFALECRPTQISQILLNLLNNAFDSVKDQPEKWVRVSGKKIGDLLEISVTDSGPGINPELRNRIFEPFFTTKPIGKGTGLGLSISRGLVEGHGGKLLLDSNSKATRFRIVLPVHHEGKVGT